MEEQRYKATCVNIHIIYIFMNNVISDVDIRAETLLQKLPYNNMLGLENRPYIHIDVFPIL